MTHQRVGSAFRRYSLDLKEKTVTIEPLIADTDYPFGAIDLPTFHPVRTRNEISIINHKDICLIMI